nr:COP9 signalosome complex subunit 5b-like [Tanacetum cinerariifolium]
MVNADSNSEVKERETKPDDDYDPYDDDLYDGYNMSINLQSICDDLDIKPPDANAKASSSKHVDQGEASKQRPKSGMDAPTTSNSFDVLNTLNEVENSEELNLKNSNEMEQGNKEKNHDKITPLQSVNTSRNTDSIRDPGSSNADYDFGNPESDKDEVYEPDDTSYMSSFGGGNQLEDYFSDGYEAQVLSYWFRSGCDETGSAYLIVLVSINGLIEIGAFRTYPEGYKPSDEPVSEYQTIPLNKIEDFGVHCKQYYSLDITYFKSSLDCHLLDLLWNKYWVNTLSSSPLLGNGDYVAGQISDLAEKLEQAEGQLSHTRFGPLMPPSQRKKEEESPLAKITKDSAKITVEQVHGLMSQMVSDSDECGVSIVTMLFSSSHVCCAIAADDDRELYGSIVSILRVLFVSCDDYDYMPPFVVYIRLQPVFVIRVVFGPWLM